MQTIPDILIKFLNATHEVFIMGPMPVKTKFLDEFFSQHPDCPIIYIDSGSKNYHRPGLSIGDGDSSKKKCDIAFSSEKNYTDLEGALRILPPSIKIIHGAGFVGGRLDHQLVVIQDFLNHVREHKSKIFHYGDDILHFLPEGSHQMELNSLFSILSDKKQTISIQGNCRFQVKNLTLLPFSGHGISNEGMGALEIINSKAIALMVISNNLDRGI